MFALQAPQRYTLEQVNENRTRKSNKLWDWLKAADMLDKFFSHKQLKGKSTEYFCAFATTIASQHLSIHSVVANATV